MELVELTEYIVKQILPNEEVKVNYVTDQGINVIQILVKENNMGKVIGHKGLIANSIRTIVEACAYTKKLGKVRINIDSI